MIGDIRILQHPDGTEEWQMLVMGCAGFDDSGSPHFTGQNEWVGVPIIPAGEWKRERDGSVRMLTVAPPCESPEVGASPEVMIHGFDCKKVWHTGNGHLHREDDDSPYDVDGVLYCGRCHHFLPASERYMNRRPKREPCNTCNRMTTIRCPQCRQPCCVAHCLKMADGDSDGCLHCRRQEAAEIRAVNAQVAAKQMEVP